MWNYYLAKKDGTCKHYPTGYHARNAQVPSFDSCAQMCKDWEAFECQSFVFDFKALVERGASNCVIKSAKCEQYYALGDPFVKKFMIFDYYDVAAVPAKPVTTYQQPVASPGAKTIQPATTEPMKAEQNEDISTYTARIAVLEKMLKAAKMQDQLHQLALGQDLDGEIAQLEKQLRIAELKDQLAARQDATTIMLI